MIKSNKFILLSYILETIIVYFLSKWALMCYWVYSPPFDQVGHHLPLKYVFLKENYNLFNLFDVYILALIFVLLMGYKSVKKREQNLKEFYLDYYNSLNYSLSFVFVWGLLFFPKIGNFVLDSVGVFGLLSLVTIPLYLYFIVIIWMLGFNMYFYFRAIILSKVFKKERN